MLSILWCQYLCGNDLVSFGTVFSHLKSEGAWREAVCKNMLVVNTIPDCCLGNSIKGWYIWYPTAEQGGINISWLGWTEQWIVDWLGFGLRNVQGWMSGNETLAPVNLATWWQGLAGSRGSFLSRHLLPSLLPSPLYSHLNYFLRRVSRVIIQDIEKVIMESRQTPLYFILSFLVRQIVRWVD